MKLRGSPSARCASTTVAGPNVMFGGGMTVVVADAVLLAVFGSVTELDTVAVFVRVPVWVGTTTISTVAVAPLPIVPRLQVTVAVPEQVPWLGVVELYVTFAGRVSVRVVFVAASGPRFRAV